MQFLLIFLGLIGFAFAENPTPTSKPAMGIDALRSYASTLSGEQQEAANFLIKHLPADDRDSLPLDLFQENLEIAFLVRETHDWARDLPQDLFFNEVLPYAVVDEVRAPWRKELYQLLKPVLSEASTLLQAIEAVSENVEKLSGVKYSTEREKACQNPIESMSSGLASCTGLSILMVDSLRAAGIPARLVTIPLWGSREGNHTWTEVHDGEKWRATGYGSTPKDWDQGWEIDRCAFSDVNDPLTCIYASSYTPTNIEFPTIWSWNMQRGQPYFSEERDENKTLTSLTWEFQKNKSHAIDRTRHYLSLAGGYKTPVPKGQAVLSIRVFEGESNTRITVPITVRRDQEIIFTGKSSDNSRDYNDCIRITTEPDDLIIEYQLADSTWVPLPTTAKADEDTAVSIRIPDNAEK